MLLRKRATPTALEPPQARGDSTVAAQQAATQILKQIADTHRPTLRFTLQPADDDDPFDNKVGGLPYWPQDEPLPEHNGAPMIHLAQLNFKRLPAHAIDLPDHGILQFFLAADDDLYGLDFDQPLRQDGFRVRYWPWPNNHADSLRTTWPHPNDGLAPHSPPQPLQMNFKQAMDESISIRDVDIDGLIGESIWAMVERLAEDHQVSEDAIYDQLPTGAGHKLGGYPFFTQEDPRPPNSQWRLLLQLDSDEHMMWGDVGVANFFIEPAALASADFSRVWYNWDCH